MFVEMERKLKANDWKDHWSNFSIEYCFERLAEYELPELKLAISKLADAEMTGEDIGRLALDVVEEAADGANYAMMIADIMDNKESKAKKE